MPSPVGHALAGVAVGWLIDGRRAIVDAAWRRAAAYVLLATLPDADLLVGSHRGPSHGLGTAFLVGIIVAVATRRLRVAIACALAFASHILLDWLGTDTTPPIGLMALWPFSREYYEAPYHVFMAVSRRYWLPEFWTYNVRVVLREIVILGPFAFGAALSARRARALRARAR